MLKLARWTTTHRKYVLIGWVALLLVVNVFAQSAGTSYSNNFTLPNSDAQRASDLLEHSFPAQAGDRDTIVYKVSSGTVRDPAVRARMSAMFAQVSRLPHVTAVISPYAGASAGKAISPSGQIAFATVVFDQKANLLPKSAPERVVQVARAAERPGLEVQLGGQAIEATEQAGFGVSTAVGLLAAIVVLLLTFGSLTAMGLPIVTALFGLGTGLGAIALFTHVVDTPNFSSELAAMIGLGVGIDYALFILTRFREAYRTPGPTFGDARESVVQAMDTAGRAVLFAGTTVVIALLGMMLLGVDFLYGVAISASIGVLLVMLASLTLLPALLTMAGARVARPGRRSACSRKPARRSPAMARRSSQGPPPALWRCRPRGARLAAGEARAVVSARRRQRTAAAPPRRRSLAALERVRAAPAADDRGLRHAGDAADRQRPRSRCGWAPATPPTIPRARPRIARMSSWRRGSAKGSTARCWSSRRCPTRPVKPPSRACSWCRPRAAARRLSKSSGRRSPPRPVSYRSPRQSSTRLGTWRRSPSIHAPRPRRTRPPNS